MLPWELPSALFKSVSPLAIYVASTGTEFKTRHADWEGLLPRPAFRT